MWPILLSHHRPEHAERCVRFGHLPVCRRCLATWPLALLVLATGLARGLPVAGPPELALWLVAPVGEYVAVHLGALRYAPGRTWAMGLLLGVGLGRLFHRYLLDPTDPLAWAALLAVAVPTAAAALYHDIAKKS